MSKFRSKGDKYHDFVIQHAHDGHKHSAYDDSMMLFLLFINFCSVTAEMWVPLKEVPEESLQEYLTTMKKEGYVVVGLEQTANSVSLQKYNFPKRTVCIS